MARDPVLVTGPTEYPVSVDEVRRQLKITHTEEDDWIHEEIIAATDQAEEYCWGRFVTQTWKQYFDDFDDPMLLWYPPLSSVETISYVDTGGNSQTAGSSLYETGDENGVGLVRLKYSQSWPACRGHEDDVQITYVCGYGLASSVPAKIKKAIKIAVAHAYWHREGEEPLPQAFYDLLRNHSYKRPRPVAA